MSILKYDIDRMKGIKPNYPKKKTFEEMTPEEREIALREREARLLAQADELDRQADERSKRLDAFYGDTSV